MGATDAWKSSPKVLLVDYHEPVRYNHEAFFVNLEMSKPTYQILIWLMIRGMNGLWFSINFGNVIIPTAFTPWFFRGVGRLKPPTRLSINPQCFVATVPMFSMWNRHWHWRNSQRIGLRSCHPSRSPRTIWRSWPCTAPLGFSTTHGEGLDQLFGYEVMESGDFNDFTQGT